MIVTEKPFKNIHRTKQLTGRKHAKMHENYSVSFVIKSQSVLLSSPNQKKVSTHDCKTSDSLKYLWERHLRNRLH